MRREHGQVNYSLPIVSVSLVGAVMLFCLSGLLASALFAAEEKSNLPEMVLVDGSVRIPNKVFFGVLHPERVNDMETTFLFEKHGPFLPGTGMPDRIGVHIGKWDRVGIGMFQELRTAFSYKESLTKLKNRGVLATLFRKRESTHIYFDNATDNEVAISVNGQILPQLPSRSFAKFELEEGNEYHIDVRRPGGAELLDSKTVYLPISYDWNRSKRPLDRQTIAFYIYNVAGRNIYRTQVAVYKHERKP